MFGKKTVVDMINRSAVNEADRRAFLRTAGLAGLGAVGTATVLGSGAMPAFADDDPDGAATDIAILNFALNLEYLEAEFYLRAYTGEGLPSYDIDGSTKPGKVTGGKKVTFTTKAIELYAREISQDERAHVKFLRSALGSLKVSRPEIDLQASFTAAAQAAGLISATQTFDPFANENNFLLAAFLFEDVGVTAYKGAAPLITNKTYLEAAAGILAVEAYHAGVVRSAIYQRGTNLRDAARKISDARDSLDGKSDDDQGPGSHVYANLTPVDANSIAYSRSAADVLNIVYLTPAPVSKGGFFPSGVNGQIIRSNDNR